jgi:hypothetical protein
VEELVMSILGRIANNEPHRGIRSAPPEPPSWVTTRPTGSPKQLDAQGKLGSGGKPAMTTAQVDARLSEMDKDWGMKNGYAKPYDVSGR